MKKFIIYTLKRFVPLYAVTFAICFSTFLTYFSGIPNTYDVYTGENYYAYYANSLFGIGRSSGLLLVAILFAILTTILPVFANTYRTSIKGADIFYQVGKGKKSIRFVNNLVLLIAVIISFTVAFMFGIGVLALRQLPNIGREPEVLSENFIRYYSLYNFAYYIPAYLFILNVGIVNYFISYFLVTRANNTLNSIIMLVLGEIILGVGLMTPIWYSTLLIQSGNPDFSVPYSAITLPVTQTWGIVGPIAWIQMAFDGLITGANSGISTYLPSANYQSDEVFSIVLSIIGLVGFIGMGLLGVYYFLNEEESSGELCGKPQGRGAMQIIIFHIGFGIICLWSTALSAITATSGIWATVGIISVISQTTICGAIYFVFTGLIRRNFKLNLKEFFILISSVTINMTFGIVLASLASSH